MAERGVLAVAEPVVRSSRSAASAQLGRASGTGRRTGRVGTSADARGWRRPRGPRRRPACAPSCVRRHDRAGRASTERGRATGCRRARGPAWTSGVAPGESHRSSFDRASCCRDHVSTRSNARDRGTVTTQCRAPMPLVLLARRRRHPAGTTPATSPTRPPPRRRTSPVRWRSRCSSRARPASARPSWRRRSRGSTGAELVRLQCYEGLDEARALYEWNYKKQLLRIQASGGDAVLGRDPRRHLHRRVPADPAAADRDPAGGADGAADRRGRQDRRRGRGAAARGAVRLPGDDPRARHRRRRTPPVRRPHLQRDPRAVRGAQAALPLPAPRLPGRRARAGDRHLAGARARGPGRRASWWRRSAGCASST